jgi:hypothetical protein
MEAKWLVRYSSKSDGGSQSPVLPWAGLAYDACLSAGSTARMADDPPRRSNR